jgi:hypothetical protein
MATEPFTMGINIETPVQIDRDRAAKQVADANAKFAELQEAYNNSPEQKLERDRAALAAMENDPFHLGKKLAGSATAAANEQALRSRIAVAEAAIAAVPQTDMERIDAVLAGKADVSMSEVTTDPQIPMRDFASGYGDILARGVRPETIKAFEATGYADDPVGEGQEFQAAMAAEWERRLLADPELQRRFLAKDPELMRQFEYYGIYAQDPRKIPHE